MEHTLHHPLLPEQYHILHNREDRENLWSQINGVSKKGNLQYKDKPGTPLQ